MFKILAHEYYMTLFLEQGTVFDGVFVMFLIIRPLREKKIL